MVTRRVVRRTYSADADTVALADAMKRSVVEGTSEAMDAEGIEAFIAAKGYLPGLKKVQFPMATEKQIVKFDGGFFDGPKRRSPAIGIDSSATGFAFAVFAPEDGTWCAWRLKSPKDSSGAGAWRLLQIRDFFSRTLHGVIMRSPEVLHVCMEGYGFATQMAHTLGEVGGVVKLVLTDRIGWDKIEAYPTFVSPAQLKKFTTGSGSTEVKKQQIMLVSFKKWGYDIPDDNALEALVLARMAAAVHNPQLASLTYEQEVVAKLREGMHQEWPQEQPRSLSRAKTPTTLSSPQTAATSSSSPPPATPRALRRRSATASTTGTPSPSGPSGPVRSIRRSRP